MAKSSVCTHLIRNERPSRSTENKHHEKNFDVTPSGDLRWLQKTKCSSPSLFCSHRETNTRDCVIASSVWVCTPLRVYITAHIALKCLLLFLPFLEGVWLTGGGGNSQQRRVLAHPVRGREWQASSASGASRNNDGSGETEPHRWPSLQHNAAIRIT